VNRGFAFTAALALLALATGCSDIELSALTVPPPGKVAQLDDSDRELTLSRGVALAFECQRWGEGYDGPCRTASAVSARPGIATVLASYLDALSQPVWEDAEEAGPRERSAFVVVGLSAGETEIEIATADGDVLLSVTVLPP
jgi:hypothetical protein